MSESLNSIEQDNVLTMLQSIFGRIRDLESKFLRLRSTTQPTAYEVLANGATDMEFDDHAVVKVTPTADATLTTAVPPAGVVVTLIVLTSGTSSFTLTFGSGFKSTGTLATGTTSARVFTLQFVSDGTNLYELSRTVAMVA